MPDGTVRTTITLDGDLLAAVDAAVRSGRARSRNELVAIALRHELGAQEWAAIDAAFAAMTEDSEYLAEAEAINREFTRADWEAFQLAERESSGDGHAAG